MKPLRDIVIRIRQKLLRTIRRFKRRYSKTANGRVWGARYVYYLRVQIQTKLLKWDGLVQGLFGLSVGAATYGATNSLPIGAATTVLTFITCLVLVYTTRFMIAVFYPTIGIPAFVRFPGKYFVRKKRPQANELNLENLDSRAFEFATKHTAWESATLNVKAFRRTIWATAPKVKYDRNFGHIEKNKHCFMFVKSLADKKNIGFTHVIPVSKRTWEKYMNQEIADNDFSADFVLGDIPEEEPYGLIIFSVACVCSDSALKATPSFRDSLGDLLEQAIVYHVNIYMTTLFKEFHTVDILLQNMGDPYLEFFKDCALIKEEFTKDLVQLIRLEVINPAKQSSKVNGQQAKKTNVTR